MSHKQTSTTCPPTPLHSRKRCREAEPGDASTYESSPPVWYRPRMVIVQFLLELAGATILFIGRTLTRSAPTCLCNASLPWPIGPEPALDNDGHIAFCQHD